MFFRLKFFFEWMHRSQILSNYTSTQLKTSALSSFLRFWKKFRLKLKTKILNSKVPPNLLFLYFSFFLKNITFLAIFSIFYAYVVILIILVIVRHFTDNFEGLKKFLHQKILKIKNNLCFSFTDPNILWNKLQMSNFMKFSSFFGLIPIILKNIFKRIWFQTERWADFEGSLLIPSIPLSVT